MRPIKYESCLRLFILIIPMLGNMIESMAINNETIKIITVYNLTPQQYNFSHSLEPSEDFPCGEPQSRSYNLRDLMSTVHEYHESVNYPLFIVSKRCDKHSGCCKSFTMSCMPIKSAIYYDKMEIEIHSILFNGTRKQWIQIEQHGLCSCKDITLDKPIYSTPTITMIQNP